MVKSTPSRVRRQAAWRVAVACAALAGCATVHRDPLYERFVRPAAETRPFVRWWWNGGRVQPTEIRRQLDIMAVAGIGGVEINTIAHPRGAAAEGLERFPALDWLSPDWNRAVRAAADHASRQGLVVDLLVGSGWPFGVRSLAVGEQTQRVILVRQAVQGPTTLETSIDLLVSFLRQGGASDAVAGSAPPWMPSDRELISLRLMPAELPSDFTPGIELASSGEEQTVDVPPGDHLLYAVIREAGFTHVKLGAPGSDGPVVDHYNATAVRKYLDRMSAALAPALDGELSDFIRAAFVDSLELDHANWTADLPASFRKRRGYELAPYLPFVLEPDDPAAEGPRWEVIRRVRYDYLSTLLELFEERFIGTYQQWARDNGLLARFQAYGRESHPLHGSMQIDLPEGETWLWPDPRHSERVSVESTVINKYVSSAANLTGQPVRSFEAMTNTVPVFRATLQDFKRAFDASVLSGVNHPIMHGFSYTPREAGFPGWVRFGSYLNERNPWWPYFRKFSDYAARVGTVMRASVAQARIAVLPPRAEEWQHHGLLYQPFPEAHYPPYQYTLMQAIHQHGYGADYISERILQRATFSQGKLHFGPCAYDVLVLQEVNAIQPQTAEAIARFARAGGRLVFIGSAPSRYPGLARMRENDLAVQRGVGAALQAAGKRAHRLDPPGGDDLLEWTGDMLARTGVPPEVRIIPAQPFVSQVHHRVHDRLGDRDVFFFVNTSTEVTARFSAAFSGIDGTPWRWDPATGQRDRLGLSGPGRALEVSLAPTGSLLVVFDPAGRGLSEPGTSSHRQLGTARLKNATRLDGPWDLELRPANGDTVFVREQVALGDLSRTRADPALSGFGGIAVYRTTFHATGERTILDLGIVHSLAEVFVNGRPAGVTWWGRHRYDLASLLVRGTNTLEVRVATVLANYMKAQRHDRQAQALAGWFEPIPTGLVGPVRLGL